MRRPLPEILSAPYSHSQAERASAFDRADATGAAVMAAARTVGSCIVHSQRGIPWPFWRSTKGHRSRVRHDRPPRLINDTADLKNRYGSAISEPIGDPERSADMDRTRELNVETEGEAACQSSHDRGMQA
jgi:hypothetical protein